MPFLELAMVMSLAKECVPSHPHLRERLVAHAKVESSWDPYAIHDNTTSATYRPQSLAEARHILSSLNGHSLDVGIAQITRANWSSIGLRSPQLLFNATANLCAGAVVLAQDYQAACMYNTGQRHCENGYPQLIDHAQAVIARQLAQGNTSDFPTAASASATTRQNVGARPSRTLESQFPKVGEK